MATGKIYKISLRFKLFNQILKTYQNLSVKQVFEIHLSVAKVSPIFEKMLNCKKGEDRNKYIDRLNVAEFLKNTK